MRIKMFENHKKMMIEIIIIIMIHNVRGKTANRIRISMSPWVPAYYPVRKKLVVMLFFCDK